MANFYHYYIWYVGKEWFCWEGIANASVILTDLFFNKIELYQDHTAVWCNTDIVDKIQPIYVNKWYANTDDDQMHWEIKLKPPQNVTPMENYWPEDVLDFANHQVALC